MNRNQKKKIIDIQLGRNYIYSELNEIRNSWNYKSIEYAIQKIVSSNTKDCKKYRNGLLPKIGRASCRERVSINV